MYTSPQTPFSFDEVRDGEWQRRMLTRLKQATQLDWLDWRAAVACGEILMKPTYPVYPGDTATRWFEQGNALCNGELHWLAMEPDAGNPFKPAMWLEDGPPERERANGLFHFEDHPDGGDGLLVLASKDGQLYFFPTKYSALLPLRASFEDYIELQITVLGMSELLPVLVDIDNHGFPEGSSTARFAGVLAREHKARAATLLANARRVFPDQDLTLLERYCD